MDRVWHSFPIRNTQCNALNPIQVGLLKKIAEGDKSYYAELKEDRSSNGVYYVEVKKVGLIQKWFGNAAERALKTDDAIVQFMRDNHQLLSDNKTVFESYVSKERADGEGEKPLVEALKDRASHASALCKNKEAFEASQEKIAMALENPSKWVVELVPDDAGDGYKVEKRKVSFYERTSKMAEASQAVAAKFMHDNSAFAKTLDKTNVVGMSVLSGALTGFRANQRSNVPKNQPSVIAAEIAQWSKLETDSKPYMKFAKERSALFSPNNFIIQSENWNSLEKLKKAVVEKLEKVAREESDPEAAYLLALYKAKEHRFYNLTHMKFVDEIEKIKENTNIKSYPWILEHCETFSGQFSKASNLFNTFAYQFPLDPLNQFGLEVSVRSGRIDAAQVVNMSKSV